ncbi:MAG: Ku protein [Actinomycetota bacterium]|nr:Ku protein [Actinomycetota bacterium]
MARPIWKGAIAFRLVSIPVRLDPVVREHRPRCNQLQRNSSDRIRCRRVNESTGKKVPFGDIVRGVALDRGRFVVLEGADLAAAAPRATRTIELLDFVGGDEIDPLYDASPYYLAPENEAARRPHALFAAPLATANRVGIASLVLREREHLCAVRSRGPLLVLETMRVGDEVRAAPEELAGLEEVEPQPRELDMARSPVGAMAGAFDPERSCDAYRERIDELVAAKARGEVVVVEQEPAPPDAEVIDLVSVLSRSMARAREDRGATGVAPGGPGPCSGRRASAGGDGGDGGDLASRSRTELYERAQAAGVPGRSKMSRDDLVAALERIGRPVRSSGRRRAS